MGWKYLSGRSRGAFVLLPPRLLELTERASDKETCCLRGALVYQPMRACYASYRPLPSQSEALFSPSFSETFTNVANTSVRQGESINEITYVRGARRSIISLAYYVHVTFAERKSRFEGNNAVIIISRACPSRSDRESTRNWLKPFRVKSFR